MWLARSWIGRSFCAAAPPAGITPYGAEQNLRFAILSLRRGNLPRHVELPAEREREDVSYAGRARRHLLHLAAQSVAYRRLTHKPSAQHALVSTISELPFRRPLGS